MSMVRLMALALATLIPARQVLAQTPCPNLSGLYLCPADRARGAPEYRLEISQDRNGRATVLRFRSPGTTAHNGLIRIDGRTRAWPSGDDAVGVQLVACEGDVIVQRVYRFNVPAPVWRTMRYRRDGDAYEETIDGAVHRRCRAIGP